MRVKLLILLIWMEGYVGALKVVSFANDNDNEADKNGRFTSAELEKENLPKSFTICASFSTEAWSAINAQFAKVAAPTFLTEEGEVWGYIRLKAGRNFTNYDVLFGTTWMKSKVFTLLFPLQWTSYCVVVHSQNLTVHLVVDGNLLAQATLEEAEGNKRPRHLNLLLGYFRTSGQNHERPGRTANLNVFSSALSLTRVKGLTKSDGKECGAVGDFLSWDVEQWRLRSKTKVVELNEEIDSPCRPESEIQLFTANFYHHRGCMQHCQKISQGRSPSVQTEKEWDYVKKQISLIR